MKKTLWKRIISLVVVVCLVVAFVPYTAQAQGKTYLALGDSISTGYGLSDATIESFPVQVVDLLGEGYSLNNLAVNGETTSSLLTNLGTTDYQNAVKNADIITITIGGNDLMGFLYEFLAGKLNMKVEDVKSALETGNQTVLALAAGVLNSTDFVPSPEQISQVQTNFISIISTIKTLNPNVAIIVTTQYNPYEKLALEIEDLLALAQIFGGVSQEVQLLANAILNLTDNIETVLGVFNAAIKNGAGSFYFVADVYTVFKNFETSLCNAKINLSPVSANLDFHPNAAGHTEIAKCVYGVICDKVLPQLALEDKTVTYDGSVQNIGSATISGIPTDFQDSVELTYTYYTDVNGTVLTTTENGAASNGGAPKNAGTYYVCATSKKFEGTVNNIQWTYSEKQSNLAKLTIEPKEISITGANITPKPYDGNNTASVASVEFSNLVSGEILINGTDYSVSGTYVDVNVGTNKVVRVEVNLLNNNYKLANNTYQAEGTIEKATYTTNVSKEITIYNGDINKGGPISLVDLFGGTSIPNGAKMEDVTAPGSVKIMDEVKIEAGELYFVSKENITGMTDTDVYKVVISSNNYNNFTIDVKFKPIDKLSVTIPTNQVGYTLEASANQIRHGESVTFTYKLKDGYTEIENSFVIKVNGTPVTPDGEGKFTVNNVNENIEVTVEGVADITSPTAQILVGTNNLWNTFLDSINFNLFFNNAQSVTITAEDTASEVNVYYYLANAKMSEEEVKALDASAWISYTTPFNISENNQYVIYVKVTDAAGNTTYISSDGFVVDTIAPAITGVVDEGVYYGDVTFGVTDTHDVTVKVDGNDVQEYKITADNAQHTITVTDKAGNQTTYTITVYKKYTVTYKADGITVGTPQIVGHGQNATAPNIPPKTGYDQTAPTWDNDGTNITSDTEINAVYTINKYTVVIPTTQVGYELTADATSVNYDGTVTFTYKLNNGYTETGSFVIKVNGVPVTLENDGTFTVEHVATNLVVTVEGVADVTPATAEITLGINKWNTFLNTITFGKFFNNTQTVEITAEDAGSQVKDIYYYLANVGMTEDTVKALEDSVWTKYTGIFNINPDNEYVIYVKVTDNAGNIAYISSDGLILDATAPAITGIENNGIYYGDVTFEATDKYDIIVKIDGNDVQEYKIPADNAQHTITVTDKAGNETIYKITVYKKYTVTYVADGKTVDTQIVNHGSNAVVPNVPHKDGYDQTAPVWDKDGVNITENTTITAIYTINKYTITIPKQESQVGYKLTVDKVTVEYGDTATLTFVLKDCYGKADGFAVKANGKTLTDTNGIYKVENISDDITITVEGVEISHSWKNEWMNDDEQHWHVCGTCGTTDTKIDHKDDGSGKCGTCGFDMEIQEEESSSEVPEESSSSEATEESSSSEATEESTSEAPEESTSEATEEQPPATGDNSQMWLWISVLVISMGGIIVATVVRKKDKDNKAK